ncbi:TlpA disulfide reductase family protein [Parabacteroides sp. Marseille-P3160]|uniref:TlpA disulfide reductase family protein n=1 Tax=Parabacteroides sp. Marseille-P3160 TaxID=1917887 RepID=UPI0009B9FBD0|nr:TlpA disulfide reductase family protein [Parabacteroides sp. Marseille-P3160]
MIKKEYFLFLFSLLCLFSSCGEKAAYRIEGKLTNLEDETLYAVFESPEKKLVDTVQCKKPGMFEILQTEPGFQTLTLFYHKKQSWITIYLEPKANISLSGDAFYPQLIQVKGSRINDKLTDFKKGIAALLREQVTLENQVDKADDDAAIKGESDALGKLRNVNYMIEEQVYAYIKKNPKEEASAILIRNYFADADDPRKMDELLAVLDPKLNDFYVVEDLKQLSEKAQRTVVGAIAPEFKIKDIEGNVLTRDSFANRFLLMAFTAPWCDICQSEEILLNEISKKYTGDKLDLLMIILEEDIEGAKNFVKRDSLRWNLVADNEGEATSMIELYNVSALPRCFLIDRERKIVLKTENGLEIKQKLEALID